MPSAADVEVGHMTSWRAWSTYADFLIGIAPSDGSEAFRSSDITFDPPD